MSVAPAGRNRVLVIGNNAQTQHIAPQLISAGFEVLQAEANQHGLSHAMDGAPHLVVLNAGTSPKDTMGLLITLRELVSVPIIMVGPDDDMPLLQSLALGADIYLTPETSSREFLAYVRALLRRHTQGGTASTGSWLQGKFPTHASA